LKFVKLKCNMSIFIEYLAKAADNNNCITQYNVGDLYINGKLSVTKNVSLGMKYLKLATSASYSRAIELLQHFEIIIFLRKTNKIYEAFQYIALVDKLKLH
ncbi:15830_t:CDS:1, partial [Funneliformis caledonium]